MSDVLGKVARVSGRQRVPALVRCLRDLGVRFEVAVALAVRPGAGFAAGG